MKTFGIVSYNKYANFTNYGSALQSWALNTAINKLGESMECRAMFVDYCPDRLANMDPLHPFENMWDQDDEACKRIEYSMQAIRENYEKFMTFYDQFFLHSKDKYTSQNFDTICGREGIDGFVCGSDTIFCYKEFGFDDGYFANYDVMRNGYSVAYAASFGDTDLRSIDKEALKAKLRNFRYLALRENQFLDFTREATEVKVEQVIDPTLLLTASDYDTIVAPRQIDEPYVLLYSRRFNPAMTKYADRLSKEKAVNVVYISLSGSNPNGHIMRYDAGVEEFLSLVKYAECIVTNSYHGMLFSIIYKRPFCLFSREQCDTKNAQVLQMLDLRDRSMVTGKESLNNTIDYDKVHKIIALRREQSLNVLINELKGIEKWLEG